MSITVELIKNLRPVDANRHRKQTRNTIIYTRVSTKEQALNNQSLETQKKQCLQYTLSHDLNVIGFYGGTYESAKTDERKEFNRMMNYIKAHKEKVAFILVYSLDRFSRTGGNAIFISSELKRNGISILSVAQQIDTDSYSGKLQESIHFIFSQYDNDLRREKCMVGMKAKLHRGEWMGRPPLGYRRTERRDKPIELDENAESVAQIFILKASNTISNTEISRQMASKGFKVSNKVLTDMLRNPFYCGYISHKLLDGKIIKGKHEALISEEVFLKVNYVMQTIPKGFKHAKTEVMPLRQFLKCGKCGISMTGYLIKKKRLSYYKCQTMACCNNRNANFIHKLFEEFLQTYPLKDHFLDPLKSNFKKTCETLTTTEKIVSIKLKSHHRKVVKEIKLLQESNDLGYVDLKVFNLTLSKLQREKQELENHLMMTSLEFRNSSLFLDKAVGECLSLASLWNSLTCFGKRKLADIVFPDGLRYHRDTDSLEVIIEGMQSIRPVDESNPESQKSIQLSGLAKKADKMLQIYRTNKIPCS
ncbi:MAG: recombinase family protein [Cyclobacteriaceae bacterium]|nr:recombinase family protein [Cyclobacteriaceae bacterium]